MVIPKNNRTEYKFIATLASHFKAIKTAYESVGGKLLFFGFIHGKWDVLLVAEAPSEKEFWAPIAQAMFGGMIKDMESFPIIEQETITGAMGMAQQAGYKAPGQ